MKTVLFVPGFQENIHSRDYRATIRGIEAAGYNVIFVPINWSRTTVTSWVEQFNTTYERFDPSQTILAGFSFGAMTVFIAATQKSPSELWLFSLSPYFAEDLKSKNMKPTWLREIGNRRVTDFASYNFRELSQLISCKTYLFAGKIEIEKWPIIGERQQTAHNLLKESSLTMVDDAGHDVTNASYINAISASIMDSSV